MPWRSFLTLLLLATLSSCATQPKWDSIRVATVSQKLHFPKRMTKQTRVDMWGTVAVGAIASSVISNSVKRKQMSEDMIRTQFEEDLRRIVEEEFEARGRFAVERSGEPTDAVIDVRVFIYGYALAGMSSGFTGKQGPMLAMMMSIKNNQGKVVWSSTTAKPTLGRGEGPPLPEREAGTYQNQPEILVQDLSAAARRVVRRMAKEIPQGAAPPPQPQN